FRGNEFAWTDSAYALNSRTIPVHKKPASLRRENAIFDRMVSHLRVHSEHCMGALKGCFQCLRGLRVTINSPKAHFKATHWIKVAIILHNLIIDIEGEVSGARFGELHTSVEEEEDAGTLDDQLDLGQDEDEGEAKRECLVAELLAYRAQCMGVV
ncbi:hypothetical protein DICSQDRAFT_65199, partial [Dichomitus squalens LYAD-421 SS1]